MLVAALIAFSAGAVWGFPGGGQSATGRELPEGLCHRLGDIDALFPQATSLKEAPLAGGVRCQAVAAKLQQPTHSQATLTITVNTFASTDDRSPVDEARRRFDTEPWPAVPAQAYPTKIRRTEHGDQWWEIEVLGVYGDTVVRVAYNAQPITRAAAERAVLILTDKALWESR